MAAVIGDFVTDPSHFHTMIANPSLQRQHSHESASSYHSDSRSRVSTTPRAQRNESEADFSNANNKPPASWSVSSAATATATTPTASAPAAVSANLQGGSSNNNSNNSNNLSATGGASRFPSPPASSSPSVVTGPANDGKPSSSMTPIATDSVPPGQAGQASQPEPTPTTSTAQQQPSPPSDDFQMSHLAAAPLAAPVSVAGATAPQQTVVHIRDLAHIQSLANADLLSGSGTGILNDPPLQQMKYEISGMPIGDIIEMVAALLTKITTTNDLQHDAMQRNVAHQQQANQSSETTGPLNHSVLAFHGKNVPAITILSYLSRIHKYCPTTYEVFLSLLVYFDRMTERVNDMVSKNEEARRRTQPQRAMSFSSRDTQMRDDASDSSDESDSDLADDDEEMEDRPPSSRPSRQSSIRGFPSSEHHATAATYFVVDSFNIHRLIISGVTCASKFFSDVFYTNSRYAKVGGLPLVELNHLELQFLLLNDFRLAVPVEDLEAYATMLVEFYAREVVAKKAAAATNPAT